MSPRLLGTFTLAVSLTASVAAFAKDSAMVAEFTGKQHGQIRDRVVKALKKAGVSVEEYKSYDAGTTIFTREQNLAAFASGSTSANLDYQAAQISEFLVSTELAKAKPSLDGLFEPKFVQAVAP